MKREDNHNIHTSGIYIIIIRNTFCKRSQQLCKNRRYSSLVITARKMKFFIFFLDVATCDKLTATLGNIGVTVIYSST